MRYNLVFILFVFWAQRAESLNCVSISAIVTNLWCNQNCNHFPPFCPSQFCSCSATVIASTSPAASRTPTTSRFVSKSVSVSKSRVLSASPSTTAKKPWFAAPTCVTYTNQWCTSQCNYDPTAPGCYVCCFPGQVPLRIEGIVRDYQTNNPLAGVTITSLVDSTKTDDNGKFSLAGGANVNGIVRVEGALNGYAPQHGVAPYDAAIFAYHIDLLLTPFTTQLQFVAAAGGQITVPDIFGTNTQVTIPPQPNFAPGTVLTFRLAVLPVIGGPGRLLSSTPGSITGSYNLQSSGMFFFDLINENGQQVALTQGVTFTVSGPTYVNTYPPGSVDDFFFYSYDPNLGVWTNPKPFTTKKLTNIGSSADAIAQSAGFWNSDRNFRTACAVGTLVNAAGQPCIGGQVIAAGVDSINSYATVESDGTFCVEGAQTLSSQMFFGGIPSNWFGYTTVVFPTNPGNCKNRSSCKSLGQFSTTNDKCPYTCVSSTTCSWTPTPSITPSISLPPAWIVNLNGGPGCVTYTDAWCTSTCRFGGLSPDPCGNCCVLVPSSSSSSVPSPSPIQTLPVDNTCYINGQYFCNENINKA